MCFSLTQFIVQSPLYAQWTAITYTITYNLDGGTAENPASYTIESESFTLTNPTKGGFTFTGWTGEGLDGSQMSVTIQKGSTGNLEFTAAWTKNGFSPKDSSTPEFVYHSLILSGQIGVIFHVYIPDMYNPSECTIDFDVAGDKSQNNPGQKYFEAITENGYTLYGFKCYINSVQMADKITAVLTYGDNQTITEEYTAKDYLSALTKDETQTADTATQKYAITNTRGDSSGVADVKFALILDSETTIEICLTPKSDYAGKISALSYAQSAIHNDDDMKRAVTSLYRYYESTMTYRNNRPNIYSN